MQVVISPQSLLETGIRVEKVDDLRLFKFTDDLQDKLEELIAKNQSATLTHTEQEELTSISELDSPWGEAPPTHIYLPQFAIGCPKMSVSEFTKKYVRNRILQKLSAQSDRLPTIGYANDSPKERLRQRDIWQLLGSPSTLRSFATSYLWKPYEGEVYKPLVTSSELKTKMSELLMAA